MLTQTMARAKRRRTLQWASNNTNGEYESRANLLDAQLIVAVHGKY